MNDQQAEKTAPLHKRSTGAEGRASPEELEYMSDVAAAMLIKAPRGGRIILWSAFAFFMVALLWASWAELDEVTSGIGQVIPSGQVQVVQNLEGGIVAELLVRSGQVVEKNQVLLRIDDTRFLSSLKEARSRYLSLLLKRARLQAESEGRQLEFPAEMAKEAPDLVREEQDLFLARRDELENNRSILAAQVDQRSQELSEAKARQGHLTRSLSLLAQELEMTEPLVEAGAISEVDVLRLRRQVNDLRGELESVKLSLPRLQSLLQESRKKAEEVELRFRSDAREQLSEILAEISQLEQSNVALQDRVKRTAVRSPVRGTIKQILVNTVGGVIQPGMDLVEIVPLDDSLLIEAKISPRDIGFLRPGQEAVVKISAYDFAIFGGLAGKVEHISADAIEDDESNSFYLVHVRTDRNYLGTSENPLQVISGMQAEVDVLTGKKTVLQYLLKPVLRAKQNALRER